MNSKAWRSMVVVASLFAAAFSATPGAAHHDCEPETIFLYCGDHVPASRLPLRFAVSGVSTTAVDNAMQAWNLVFPGNKIGCNPLCRSASGTSTISFGNTAQCGGDGSAVARTCLTYDPPGSDRIKKADIILSSSVTWKVAGGADLVTGETTGATWGNIPGASWYDVQSVLTHELGHALGLEHIGDPDDAFPSNLTDAWKYNETMYRYAFKGSTAPRTLGAGDILGLYRVAFDSYSD